MSFIVNRISVMSIIPPQLIEKRSSELSLNIGLNNSRQELFNLKTVQFRNAKKESFHEKKIILIESLMTLINVFVIIITTIKNLNVHSDQDFTEEDQNNQSAQFRYLMALSICSVFLNIVRQVCVMQIEEEGENAEKIQKSFVGIGMKIVAQSIFYFAHPSFFTIHLTVPFTFPPFDINKLLQCIVYMRFVVIIRFLLKISRFYGLRVNRVLSLYVGDKKDFGMLYTIKCFLKSNGLKSPFIIYGIIILVFPFFIFSINHRFSQDGEDYETSSSAFLEAIYDILISMISIGYGDLKHKYGLERMAYVLIIVVGSLSSTFFTLTFLEWFHLSQQEEKALRSIKRLEIKKDMYEINNKQVQQFLHTMVKNQKQKSAKKRSSQFRRNVSGNEFGPRDLPDLNQNQIFSSQQQKADMKKLLPNIFAPQKKYLSQKLYHTRDTFKDFYEKSQLELSDSIKLLIERTLLTNNLLQFYLMRQQHNNKVMENSLILDSSETIKSRKRVDDNKKMHYLRNQIIQSTYQQEGDVKSKNKEQVDGSVRFQ